MPSVRHLECTGCATPGSTRVDAITVAADDLGTRMLAKPLDERISRRIFEQVNYPVSTHVHKNGAVSAAAAKRKFVDSEHAWRRHDRPLRECPHHSQQCRAARRHRQTLAVPTPWSAAQSEARGLEHRSQTEGSVGVPLCQHRRLLDERLA